MKAAPSNVVSYASRFEQAAAVESYEQQEYSPKSYATFIWQLQQPVLKQLLSAFRQNRPQPVRLLDFACGTGRIISFLEPMVDSADGVDLSEQMVDVARTKCQKARLMAGDILAQPALLPEPYDIITCFRFVLNVEPTLRSQALRQLRRSIREPDGLLLVNVHGNSRSLRHPAVLWKRWRMRHATAEAKAQAMLNEMSPH
jgi:predicted TPR repeat methyltransferase